MDPKSDLIRGDISRIAYRTIINRIRKPQTTGGSYSTMIPFLEGSMPVYNSAGKQVRFGGKKLSYADSRTVVDNMDKMQYVVDIGGRELLIGKNASAKWDTINLKKEEFDAMKEEIETLKSMLNDLASKITS